MKKISTLFFIVAGALAVSCVKDVPAEECAGGHGMVWEGVFDQDESKTTLAPNMTKVYWEFGDVVEFYGSSTLVGTGSVTNQENLDKKAVITQKGSLSATPAFAMHKGSTASNITQTDNTLTFTIQRNQSGLFNDANISAAKVIDGSQTLRFRNLCPVFRMTVTDSEVEKIRIMLTGDDAPLSGTMAAEFGEDGTLTDASVKSSQYDYVEIAIDSPGTYYAALCPGKIDANSLNIQYSSSGDEISVITYKKPLELKAGEIYNWGDIKDHDLSSNTLPTGEIFNNYLMEVADGDRKNIKKIVFTGTTDLTALARSKVIAKGLYYMRYFSSDGTVYIYNGKGNNEFMTNPDCECMFSDLYNLVSIEGLNYLNTEATTNMAHMFSDCYKLESLDLSSFNTSSVTQMADMFYQCENLSTLDLTGFNTRNVKSMGYMFEMCYYLRTVFLGKDFVIPDGCFADEMFLLTNHDFTVYGTSESMMSFQKALFPGSDYNEECLKFAIDMGDAGWWSAWNAGAEKPSDFGYYYSWGNVEGHWKNGTDDGYVFSKDNYASTSGYSREDDWDCVNNWSSNLWRVPVAADFERLKSNCYFSRTTLNGVSGSKLASKTNGNWIFLPDAGFVSSGSRYVNSYYYTGGYSDSPYRYIYNVGTHEVVQSGAFLYYGHPVRLVAKYGSPTLTGISISPKSLTLKKGETYKLNVSLTPSNASDRTVVWTSQDPTVATVSNGKVTAVSAGTTAIIATNPETGLSGQCSVVVESIAPTSFKLVNSFTGSEIEDGALIDLTESGDGNQYYGIKVVVSPSNADYVIEWTPGNKLLLPVFGSKSDSNPYLFSGLTLGKSICSTLVCVVEDPTGKVALSKNVKFNIKVSEKQCLYVKVGSSIDFKPSTGTEKLFNSGGDSTYDGIFYTGDSSAEFDYYLHFSKPIDEIPDYAFRYNKQLKAVKMPSCLKLIGGYAFAACPNLYKVDFNEGLETISYAAFKSDSSSDTGLSEFTLPSTLVEIQDQAFLDMRKSSITIPASVKKLGSLSFGDCGSLKTVRMEGDVPSSHDVGPFGPQTNRKLTEIYVPYAYYSNYASDTYFSPYSSIIKTY